MIPFFFSGVAYHEDLNSPVSLDTAKKIQEIVKIELMNVKEGFVLELAGGFRRCVTCAYLNYHQYLLYFEILDCYWHVLYFRSIHEIYIIKIYISQSSRHSFC